MRLRALRGAITVEHNDADAIVDATEELVSAVIDRNAIAADDMVSCIFTCTDDLDAEFPAVAARRLGLASLPGEVAQHEPLLVTHGQAVAWWPERDLDHVDTSAGPQALGRALAWRHESWALRAALAEAFEHPDNAARLDAEDGVG